MKRQADKLEGEPVPATREAFLQRLQAGLRDVVRRAGERFDAAVARAAREEKDQEKTGPRVPLKPSMPDEMPPRHPLVQGLVEEGVAAGCRYGAKIKSFDAGRAILDLDRAEQVEVVLSSMIHLVPATVELTAWNAPERRAEVEMLRCVSQLLRRKLPFDRAHLERLRQILFHKGTSRGWTVNKTGLLKAVTDYVGEHGLDAEDRETVGWIGDWMVANSELAKARHYRKRFDELLSGEAPSADEPRLARGEAWADVLLDALEAASPERRDAWRALLLQAQKAKAARPSKAWSRQAPRLLDAVGRDDFARVAGRGLRRIGRAGSREVFSKAKDGTDRTLIDEDHADLLRGVVWFAGWIDDPALTAALGDATEACFKKIARHGPRNAKVGNACLHSLAAIGTAQAAAQLGRLRNRVKHPRATPRIEEALAQVAGALGISVAELEETTADTFDMEEVGVRRESLGDATALIEIRATSVALSFINAKGRRLKNPPASVRRDHGQRVKELRVLAKDMRSMLYAHRDRIERFYLTARDWDFAAWRERYLNHPLIGTLARRLIWSFAGDGVRQPGIYRDGALVDAGGEPLDPGADARVSLWHPIDSRTDEVRSLRRLLEAAEITQPFKQAHREIYLLTDAELETATYSNRFAGHVLKQRQLAALCHERGWRFKAPAIWEPAGEPPTLTLEERDLAVELLVRPVGEESGVGTYPYLSTDQVRFLDSESGAPRPLDAVPRLLFSELMRDVDLFVGVCSVGNDPGWRDSGERPVALDYWRSYSFGELGASAQSRKEVLERLLPKLAIADRCEIEGRFAVVRGNLRTYKIHLGSGNIRMSPNDQYLCIVPDRSKMPTARLFLPFEGDGQLTVILSKMLLLARDDEIEDPLITGQIRKE